MISNIYVLSPLPPSKTGTADYMRFFDQELKRLYPHIHERVTYVCETERQVQDIKEGEFTKVISITRLVLRRTDFVLLMIAANTYHCWIWDWVYKNAELRPCRIGAVIHDLSCYSLLNYMVEKGLYSLKYKDLEKALSYEFGGHSFYLVSRYHQLPQTTHKYVMGLGILLSSCEKLYTHSYYAKKLIEVCHIQNCELPQISVLQHPMENLIVDENFNYPSHEMFCMTSMGWFSENKQPYLLLEAFRIFVNTLQEKDRSCVKLYYIGAITPRDRDRLSDKVSEYQLNGLVCIIDYVKETVLNGWIKRSNLFFNLRFPSCGETSGTLRRANQQGVTTVTTNYAAFWEQSATYHVCVDFERELLEIVDIMSKEFMKWKMEQRA